MNEEIEQEKMKIEKVKSELKKIKKNDLVEYYLDLVDLLDKWFSKYEDLETLLKKQTSKLKIDLGVWIIVAFIIGLYLGKFIV